MVILENAYEPESFREAGHELVDLLADYLSQVLPGGSIPVLPDTQPEELRRRYKDRLNTVAEFDFASFVRQFLQDSIHLHHPGYVGHQVCAPVPLAALAGLASELLNNGSAVYEMGPANTAMEKVIIECMCEALGYSDDSDGILTSGGSLGNLTALLAARNTKCRSASDESGRNAAFLVSEACHYSVNKALKIMGLTDRSIFPVPVDEQYRIEISKLPDVYRWAEELGFNVVGLVANSCTTATGSYDDLSGVATFCREFDLWMHVDGAHGVAPVFSKRYRHLLKGIDLADSVVVDFHKMFLIPALATGVFFKKAECSYQTFAERATYLWNSEENDEWYDFSKRTLECTKLSMGLKVFSVLNAYGTGIFTEQVERLYELADRFADLIRTRPQFQLALTPQSNIVCFRYTGGASGRLDQVNTKLRKKIVEEGSFYLVQVDLKDGLYLRTALMNPFTKISDLERLLDQIESVAE